MATSAKPNLWALVDGGSDIGAIRNAINAMPSCLNVCGWSYVKGKRRGIVLSPEGMWSVSDNSSSRPGTVLHYAVATGCVATTALVVQMGAHVTARLGDDAADGPTAASMARANAAAWRSRGDGSTSDQREAADAIESLLETAERRQSDVLGGLEDDERIERKILELHESSAMSNFIRSLEDGVALLTIVLKDGSGSSTTTSLSVPRYVSYKTLCSLIEQAAGQRVLISFLVEVDEAVNDLTLTMNSTMTGTIGRRSMLSSVSASRRAARSKPQTKTVELRPSTVATLLHLDRPCCIVRPLVTGLVLPPRRSESPSALPADSSTGGEVALEGSGDHHHRSDELTSLMRELKAITTSSGRSHSPSLVTAEPRSEVSGQHAAELIVRIKQLLEQESASQALKEMETTSSTFGTGRSPSRRRQAPTPKLLSQEEIDGAVRRLYDQELPKVMQKRTELSDFIGEGAKRLENRPKVVGGQLTPEMEESVDRLCNQAVAHRAEKVAQLAEAVWAAVPKPQPAELTSEDVELARQRLTNSEHRKEVLDEARQKYYGPEDEQKRHKTKLDREAVQAHLESVYSGAIAKRLTKLEALQAQYGDFQLRKRPCKKLSLD